MFGGQSYLNGGGGLHVAPARHSTFTAAMHVPSFALYTDHFWLVGATGGGVGVGLGGGGGGSVWVVVGCVGRGGLTITGGGCGAGCAGCDVVGGGCCGGGPCGGGDDCT